MKEMESILSDYLSGKYTLREAQDKIIQAFNDEVLKQIEASEAEDKEWGTWEERMKVINDGT